MKKIENKKKIIIISIAVTLILAIAISFGYLGIFNIDLNNVMNVNITANKIDNAVLDTNTTNFSITVDPYNMTEETSTTYIASNTSTLNVSLDANTTKTGVTCTYDIIFNYDSSSDKYTSKTAGTFKEFTLQVIGPEVGNNEFMSEDDFPSANMTVVKNAKISNSKKGSPSLHNWTINTKFYNLAFDQSNLINKTYKGTFKVANVTCYQTEAINQININVTDLPYNNPNSNYSLSNLNGITSSNIEWNNINRMISIKNEVNDGGSATLTKTTNTTGTLLSSVITGGVGTSGDGVITKVTDNGTEQYRYQGNNPNNYVSFNNQLWRIIGYVPVCLEVSPVTEDTTINGIEFKQGEAQCTKWENRVKIIKADPIGAFAYNKSNYSSSNPIVWIGSTVQGLLNSCYLGKKDGCDKYCYAYQTTQGVCNYSQNGINENDSYGNMVESVYYNTGIAGSYSLSSSNFYAKEIIKQTSENTSIGLMYASDFGYAISGYTGNLSYSSANSQMVNNWLFGQGYEWTMTAFSSSNPVRINNFGGLNYSNAYDGYAVRPVLYLQSNVSKLSGDGTMASPYTLGM
ncbi:unknown [Mycoplasma sp. CAG:472]|nr:unknown [Mycoplasma sp. CAG:472]